MTYLGFVLKNLTRRPFRTALTLAALATAIGNVAGLLCVSDGFRESFRSVYQSHCVHIVIARQRSTDRLSSTLSDTFDPTIQEVNGVVQAAGVLLEILSVDDQKICGIPAMGMRTDSWLFADYQMSGGSVPGDAEPVVYLGKNLPDRLSIGTEGAFQLLDESFRVAGVFESGSIWENGSMILPLDSPQRLTGREGQLTYITVVVDENVDSAAISEVVASVESVDSKLLALATDG